MQIIFTILAAFRTSGKPLLPKEFDWPVIIMGSSSVRPDELHGLFTGPDSGWDVAGFVDPSKWLPKENQ